MKNLYYTLFFIVGSTISTLAQQSDLIASTDQSRNHTNMVVAGLIAPQAVHSISGRPNVESINTQAVAENAVAGKSKTMEKEMKKYFKSIPKTIMPPPANDPPFSGTP